MGSFARTGDPGLTARSLGLLLELLDQPDPVLSGSALADFLSADAAPLIGAGLLKRSGHSPTDTSIDGDDTPVSPVWHNDGFGYFGASGWVDVDADRLTTYVVDVEALCRALLPLEKNRHVTEMVPGVLWDLGTVRLPHRRLRVPVTIARRVFDRASWHAVRTRLIDRPQRDRIVIIAGARRDAPDNMPTGSRAAFLGDVLEQGRLALNLARIVAILDGGVPADPGDPVTVIGEGREVRLYGEVFLFPKGVQQRRIIRAVHQRYLDGERRISWTELVEELNLADRSRLRDYFKNNNQPVIGRLLYEGGGMVGFCLRD
jgi:hypothetical protein